MHCAQHTAMRAPAHAQAQEVTFEKFREDKKSPAILARCSIWLTSCYQGHAGLTRGPLGVMLVAGVGLLGAALQSRCQSGWCAHTWPDMAAAPRRGAG